MQQFTKRSGAQVWTPESSRHQTGDLGGSCVYDAGSGMDKRSGWEMGPEEVTQVGRILCKHPRTFS